MTDGDSPPTSGRGHWSNDDWQRWAEKRLPEQRYVGPHFDQLVGSNVTRFRKARGLSQADLAAAISDDGDLVHQQTIQKVEKGTRPLKYSEAIHISNVLGISPVDLCDSPMRAESNGHFMRAIGAVTSAQKDLDAAAERLIRALVLLGGYISFHEDGSEQFQPDAHLVEHAKRLLNVNWGDALLAKMREILDSPLAASIDSEMLARVPGSDTYRQIIDDVRDQIAKESDSS